MSKIYDTCRKCGMPCEIVTDGPCLFCFYDRELNKRVSK